MNAPRTIADAIVHFEHLVSTITTDDPEFETDSLLCGNKGLLKELLDFIAQTPDNKGIRFTRTEMLSADAGSSFWAITADTINRMPTLARHVAHFCQLRRCSIVVKIDGNEIRANAPNAADCERLLMATDRLTIVRNSDKRVDGQTDAK